jgi:hypothetical protein
MVSLILCFLNLKGGLSHRTLFYIEFFCFLFLYVAMGIEPVDVALHRRFIFKLFITQQGFNHRTLHYIGFQYFFFTWYICIINIIIRHIFCGSPFHASLTIYLHITSICKINMKITCWKGNWKLHDLCAMLSWH